MPNSTTKRKSSYHPTEIMLAFMMIAGCGLVDSEPEREPVTNVGNYYYPIDSGLHHLFLVRNLTGSGLEYELAMEMKGPQIDLSYRDRPVYRCEWESSAASIYYDSYYSVDTDTAYYLGPESNETLPWVDLVSPLTLDATWSFDHDIGKVVARVTSLGASAVIRGIKGNQVFKNVVAVEYSANEQQRIKWFAPGVGLIAEWRNLKGLPQESRYLVSRI